MSADNTAILDALDQAMTQDAAGDGLVGAWEKNLPALFKAHQEGASVIDLIDRRLGAWAQRDPKLAPAVAGIVRAEAAGPETSSHHAFVRSVQTSLKDALEDHPDLREGNGDPIRCVSKQTFLNWGRTVENTPFITFIPKTKSGVSAIVSWARANGKTVRVAGYRHTWTDLYGADDQVLISLLPLDIVEDLPAQEPPIDPTDELQGIEIVGQVGGKALCKIGAATTNEQFRRWCLSKLPGGGKWLWTVPLNVIMVEITWGGSNAPVCHGAGWKNKTLSDLVAEIEFVNAKGELQTVDDPDQLRAAAGCFGLLGVVTSVTLRLDPMTFANMTPLKQVVPLTIPPPAGLTVPPNIDMSGITPAQLAAAWADFVDRCENDYYAEWFWFTFQDKCWINTWKNDGAKADAKDYPGPLEVKLQEWEEYLAGLMIESAIFNALPNETQAKLLGGGAMVALPDDTTIVTPLIDGLHFRRGIQNMRVLDMELEIPIPARTDDPSQPDWSICQKAWWAVIVAVYNRFNSDSSDVPMRLTLEMRIMADSDVLMAPQYGNDFGTCAIEVLTPLNVPADDWQGFMQEIADAWLALTDGNGNLLKVRSHWAKQWQGLEFRGKPILQYIQQDGFNDTIPLFGAQLEAVAAAGGYTLTDMQKLFSNPLLDEIFASIFP